MRRFVPCALILLLMATSRVSGEDGRKIRLTLRLHSGKLAIGLATEYDESRVVLEAGGQLVPIQWVDVEVASAYQAKKALLAAVRGSLANLTAEDHYQLGYFLAVQGNHAAAVAEFRKAQRRDAAFKGRVKNAWREIRRAKERNAPRKPEVLYPEESTPTPGALGKTRHGMIYQRYSEEEHRQTLRLARQFGESEVRSKIAPDLVLLETRHFLIWTDWPEDKRNLIPDWAEQLYATMCDEFGFPQDEPIWRGKCPIFCFKNKARFEEFARVFDGYDSTEALGYTKTNSHGYVHVVLRRLGNRPADIDKFATTMVHETAHAFMHCYGSPRTLPPWLNEGLADYIAERVLGRRCPTGENAVAVARQYLIQKKSIKEVFTYQHSPPGHYYPVCHSLVQYLIHNNAEAFVGMINDIKEGLDGDQALAKRYKGMNTSQLEHAWRAWVRRTHISE